MSGPPAILTRRLNNDLQQLINDPNVHSYFRYESSHFENEYPHGRFFIYGYLLLRSEPYNYGSFKVEITVYYTFPFKPPELLFLTCIHHTATCINNQIFTVCNCPNKKWSPSTSIAEWIKIYIDLLDGVTCMQKSCGFDPHHAKLRNQIEYKQMAMTMIEKYAQPRRNPSTMTLKSTTKKMMRRQLKFDSTKIDQLSLSESLKQYLSSFHDNN